MESHTTLLSHLGKCQVHYDRIMFIPVRTNKHDSSSDQLVNINRIEFQINSQLSYLVQDFDIYQINNDILFYGDVFLEIKKMAKNGAN